MSSFLAVNSAYTLFSEQSFPIAKNSKTDQKLTALDCDSRTEITLTHPHKAKACFEQPYLGATKLDPVSLSLAERPTSPIVITSTSGR